LKYSASNAARSTTNVEVFAGESLIAEARVELAKALPRGSAGNTGDRSSERHEGRRLTVDARQAVRYGSVIPRTGVLFVCINVRRTEADVTHQLTVVSLAVRDRGPARISKTRYERRMKLQGVRACAKDSDKQTLLMPAG
jgi:hypothetical protein